MKYSPSPSLSDYRKLRLPNTKSDLLKCLEQPGQSEPPLTYDCKLLDGAVIVHCLLISAVSTFHEYADRVFIPHIEKQLQEAVRMDVVRDTYIPESLKASAEEKRGKGVRRKVSGETKLLDKWMDFLCDQLTRRSFLPSKVEDFNWHPTKAVYVTSGQAVATVGASISMQNCNHEEADLRCGSCASWSSTRRKDNQIRTVDTYVVLILVGKLHDLITIQPLADIWVAFGMGNNYRFYHINVICASLGDPQSRALPAFDVFSGCDITSAFGGKGKKSIWQAWQAYKEVTNSLHLCILPVIPFKS